MIKNMMKYNLGCGCVSPMISHGLSKKGIPAFQHATKVQFANARGDPKLQMLINPGIHIRWRGVQLRFFDGCNHDEIAPIRWDYIKLYCRSTYKCTSTYSFSRMRNKGSRFTLGVWRLRVCSLDVAQPFATVRNRSQPFATVRNRSQPFATVRVRAVWPGRAYGKFCKRDHFWRFETLRCFVSRGRRGTSWHSDAFRNVWKAVLCGRRNTFPTF